MMFPGPSAQLAEAPSYRLKFRWSMATAHGLVCGHASTPAKAKFTHRNSRKQRDPSERRQDVLDLNVDARESFRIDREFALDLVGVDEYGSR